MYQMILNWSKIIVLLYECRYEPRTAGIGRCKHIGGGSKYTVIWSETAHKEYPLLEAPKWHVLDSGSKAPPTQGRPMRSPKKLGVKRSSLSIKSKYLVLKFLFNKQLYIY